MAWAVASGAFALTAAIYLNAAQDLLTPAYGLAPVVQPVDVWSVVARGVLAAFCGALSAIIAVLRVRVPPGARET
ncbi:MAG: hypothetical protein AAFY90_14420 [Pseudomonadota bacterium]